MFGKALEINLLPDISQEIWSDIKVLVNQDCVTREGLGKIMENTFFDINNVIIKHGIFK